MPVITISPQYGSYGDGVAELLCDRLGCRLLDKGLLRRLAAEAGLNPEKVVRLSEDSYEPHTLMEKFASSTPRTRDATMWAQYGWGVRRNQFAAEPVVRLIRAAYEAGNMVILGRGSQVVLADERGVLHVRLVAPLEMRIRRHQVRAGLDATEAREQVLARDRASAEFVKRYFDVDAADPGLYDLVINTGKLPLDAAADMIVMALAAVEGERTEWPGAEGCLAP